MSKESESELITAVSEMVKFSAKYYKDLKSASVPDNLACQLVRDAHLRLWESLVQRILKPLP